MKKALLLLAIVLVVATMATIAPAHAGDSMNQFQAEIVQCMDNGRIHAMASYLAIQKAEIVVGFMARDMKPNKEAQAIICAFTQALALTNEAADLWGQGDVPEAIVKLEEARRVLKNS